MARGFRNLENMMALIYLKCSDLVIPLNNRSQPSSERRNAMRHKANDQRKAREAANQLKQLYAPKNPPLCRGDGQALGATFSGRGLPRARIQ